MTPVRPSGSHVIFESSLTPSNFAHLTPVRVPNDPQHDQKPTTYAVKTSGMLRAIPTIMNTLAKTTLGFMMLTNIACGSGIGFVTHGGAIILDSYDWLTFEEANREEQRAAEIVNTYYGSHDALNGMQNVQVQVLPSDHVPCGKSDIAVGCTTVAAYLSTQITLAIDGPCAAHWSAYRHEAVHAMIWFKTHQGIDSGHTIDAIWAPTRSNEVCN